MAKQKGGGKLRRSGKDKSYYANHYHVTARNKLRREERRKRKAALWTYKSVPKIKGKSRRRRRSLKWERMAKDHGVQQVKTNEQGNNLEA